MIVVVVAVVVVVVLIGSVVAGLAVVAGILVLGEGGNAGTAVVLVGNNGSLDSHPLGLLERDGAEERPYVGP